MSTETDRILCSVAMWMLAICIWILPQEAQSANPNQQAMTEVRLEKANRALAEGNHAQAMQLLTAVLQTSPEQADAYLTLGKLYEADGQPDKAKASYELYVQKRNGQYPTDPKVLLQLRRFGLY